MSIPPETRYARNGAIHLAYQVLGSGPPNLPVSRTIRDLVAGAPVRLESRGVYQLKGVPGSWEVFAVIS